MHKVVVEPKNTFTGDDIRLRFNSYAMLVVITGTEGKIVIPDFASSDERLNTFPVAPLNSYYILPETDFVVKNDSSDKSLILFIASCDI